MVSTHFCSRTPLEPRRPKTASRSSPGLSSKFPPYLGCVADAPHEIPFRFQPFEKKRPEIHVKVIEIFCKKWTSNESSNWKKCCKCVKQIINKKVLSACTSQVAKQAETQTLQSLILMSYPVRNRSFHFSRFMENVIELAPKWSSN
jgi:hypothetical protein